MALPSETNLPHPPRSWFPHPKALHFRVLVDLREPPSYDGISFQCEAPGKPARLSLSQPQDSDTPRLQAEGELPGEDTQLPTRARGIPEVACFVGAITDEP